MQCPNEEKFAQYEEGKLDGNEHFEFLSHLSECSDCSTLYAITYGHIYGLALRETCPSEESIACFAEGKLNQAQREALLEHMADCETCSTVFYLSNPVKIAAAPQKMKYIFRLIKIAALIALIIGYDIYIRSIIINTTQDENLYQYDISQSYNRYQLINTSITNNRIKYLSRYESTFFSICMSGSLEQIFLAIANGANVNEKDPYGMTPLMVVHDPIVIAFLINAGADVNARNSFGSSPLMEAAKNNTNSEVIIILLKHGANPNAIDYNEKKAIDYANGNEYLKNTEALRKLEESSYY
jgi:hypothetical protein